MSDKPTHLSLPRGFLCLLKPGCCLALLALPVLWGCSDGAREQREAKRPVAVEVAAVERGSITLKRMLGGTLRARASFDAAAKVDGRVRELRVDMGDAVEKDAVIAVLDDESFVQELRQAEAALLVAQAELEEAEARKRNAEKTWERTRQLHERGFASDSIRDNAEAEAETARAAVAVARAEIARAEAQLQSARIRHGYTQVQAKWSAADGSRVVAERYVDEGDMVVANEPLVRVVDSDPLIGHVYVTEQDYPLVSRGMPVSIRADAYPGESFSGKVVRLSPVFSETTRQAEVEFEVANPDRRLKPGMFVRALLELKHVSDAQLVPEAALVRRDEEVGLFVLTQEGQHVNWLPVTVGIREGDRLEVIGEGLQGRQVVTLGHQLLKDGVAVNITSLSESTQP